MGRDDLTNQLALSAEDEADDHQLFVISNLRCPEPTAQTQEQNQSELQIHFQLAWSSGNLLQ